MVDDLLRHDYRQVPWGESAELLVINSCAVTGTASQKTRQIVRQARRRHPEAYLVLMGCDATVDRGAWEQEGPDLVLPHPLTRPLSECLPEQLSAGSGVSISQPGEAVEGFFLSGVALDTERTRANLKIQDGCDFRCSYCVIPSVRGPSRSRDSQDVLREARELAGRGIRELVLCGVNVTTYHNNGLDLAGLTRRILELPGEFRVRIGSAEPGPAIEGVVELMEQEPRLCRFLHLPLQYGEDTVLRKMHRQYTTAQYASMVEEAARRIPGLCLGCDVIVGFPGETEEQFQACREYLANLPLSLIHVFPFSPRPGTPAADMPGRPAGRVVAARVEELLALARQKAEAFAKTQVGGTLPLLVEEENPPSGWSDNYLHITLSKDCDIPRNSLVKAHIRTALGGRELLGE